MLRSNISGAARQAQTGGSARATIREVDDNHLVQEIKQGDVYHSETHSGYERYQTIGVTAVPLKQKGLQQGQDQAGKAGQLNHNQPKGESAEAVHSYINGDRSHVIAASMDDRRVRPYDMEEGQSSFYSADGSGQMLLHRDDGAYLITRNGKSYKDDDKTRIVSLRHVSKSYQERKPDPKRQQKFNHLGSPNMEVRVTSNSIEFYQGTSLVGKYSGGVWILQMPGDPTKSVRVDQNHTHIRCKGHRIWVDEGGCWSTEPIEVKDDPND